MKTISIAKDFTEVPAGRYLSDGDWTGEKFRLNFLAPALEAADKENPVIVDINDVEGYGSSFLEEAFGGLVRKGGYTKEQLAELLQISANPVFAIYKNIIMQHIKEAVKDA